MYLFPSPERWLIKVWKILYKNVRSSILCKFFYATFAGITKGGKTKKIQKPSTCRATLFPDMFWSIFPVFHLTWSTCRATKHLLWVAKSIARVYFEQQILALSLISHQPCILSCNKFAHVEEQVEGFCISYFATLI